MKEPVEGPTASAVREQAAWLRGELELWLGELAARSPVPSSPDRVLELVQDALGRPSDLRHRFVEPEPGAQALVLSIDGLVDEDLLHGTVLRPLLQGAAADALRLPASSLAAVGRVGEIADRLVRGEAVVHVAGQPVAWAVAVRGFKHREPSEPELEPTIRGSRESLVEALRVNTASLRRRVASRDLRVEELELGRVTRTRVAIVYVAGRADPRTVAEVRRRLSAMPWDALYSAQQVESLLEDRTWSLFPQIRSTERPDVCAAALHEGRVVILTDGTPIALIVPTFFWDLLQTPDDYDLRWVFALGLRGIRLAAVLLMLAVLPIYVAVSNFHQELIPSEFFLTLVAAREGVPFPTLAEALLLNFAFDLLREASTRLPKQVGGALTIVGALVIGESAVRGGFLSAPMVILIGTGALSAFVLPAFSTTIPFRALNYALLVLGGTLGLFGVSFGLILILGHLASLTSLGLPFLSPLAPFEPQAQEDVLVRLPYAVQEGPPPRVGRAGTTSGAGGGG